MRASRAEGTSKSTARAASEAERTANPAVFQSLKTYEELKQRLYEHFFENQPLDISNKSYADSYSAPYALVNSSQFIVARDRQFENIERTFLEVYRGDLQAFAARIGERISAAAGLRAVGLGADELVACITKWLDTYTRFNHWIYRTFMVIERNSMRAQGHRLYFEGVRILKREVIDRLYPEIYAAALECLELFKRGRLGEYEPLQTLIKYIGIMGFTKFQLVDMVKTDDRFEYSSSRKEGEQPENPYDTATFKKDFIARLTKDVKAKYTELASEMMQLSTPEYFERARDYIEAEERTADLFYGFKHARDIVIRNVLEILVVERAEGLLRNAKSGLARMMKEGDITSLAKIFATLKKANMARLFYKEFQGYVQAEGEQILGKISAEDERALKKQAITGILGEIMGFSELMEKARAQIDWCDAELERAQNAGFQGFCNTSNKVWNYLAYYADLMLRKEALGSSEELVSQVAKIAKYLYSYDYFIKMHQKLLGLRILYDNFKNQEAECALLGMLKNEAGLNATSKLSNMISDQKNSEAWNTQFELSHKFGFGFDVMMLTSGSWEINDPRCGKASVPPQLLEAVEQFEAKFLQKMPNRAISWIFSHGRAIVQLVNRAGAKYVLVLNNYQMLTLLYLQSNQYRAAKYGELALALRVEDEAFFKNSLLALLKSGVLVRTGNSVKIESKSDELAFNYDFKYKTQKVGCIVVPKCTEKAANISSEVSAERCILIDAALVKIMKQRRRASYSEVIAEVQKMCKTFKAEVSQIKMRIQNCQQRQFLERDGADMNLLVYMP